jgi:putative transposase
MPQALKNIKLLLEASAETFRSLDGQSRICNWLYNHLLQKAYTLRQEFIETGSAALAKTLYTERGLRNEIPNLKNDHPFLKSVHSSPLKNSALRLSQAIQAHQKSKKGKRKGNRVSWPKFRSWQRNWFSLLYDEPNKGFTCSDTTLVVSLGMGEEKKRHSLSFQVKEVHLLEGYEIRTLRIIKQAGQYYAIFTVQVKVPEKKPIQRAIALDPNHKNLVYGVDTQQRGIEVSAPHFLKTFDKRIDELKSKRDRCQKKAKKMAVIDSKGKPTGKEFFLPSKRWNKLNRAIERVLRTRQEQTKTYMYTLAHCLCKQYDFIGIGDYTPSGEGITTAMRRAMNNRSLIGRFKETLFWVAEKSGKTCFEYDEKNTTRTCYLCEYEHKSGLTPDIRKWECPCCKTMHLRDENAGQNGLKKILRDLEKNCETKVSLVPGSGLAPVTERWAWRVLPSGIKHIPRGQEQLFKEQRQEIKLEA